MTTSDITAEAVELEASYEIVYRDNSYRIVSGYRLVDLLAAHSLPGKLEITRIGAPA